MPDRHLLFFKAQLAKDIPYIKKLSANGQIRDIHKDAAPSQLSE
jgi:hypothetical protein